MRDVINCIKKYVEVTEEEQFIIHWKELARRLLNGINDEYQRKYHEPDIVNTIETIINNIGQFRAKNRNFNISTNSIFIHGTKSWVEFEYYGKKSQRELGDIIFILSVIYNGRKFFEKMTINQVKKSTTMSWNFGNNSSKEQLYLLSRFPTFRGVNRSLIPMKNYNLANKSGCLGTHGLLYYPGDFALISSKELEVILSRKNKLQLDNLVERIEPNTVCSCFPCCHLLYDIDFEECFYVLYKYHHYYPKYSRHIPFIYNMPILGSRCISYNVYDFSNKFLVGHIGELIYAKKFPYNKSAFQFLKDLLSVIRIKAQREQAKNVLNFISSFYKYGYGGQEDEGNREFNYEGGGIGIIHTMVNLGEGE